MDLLKIDSKVSITKQPTLDDFSRLAAEGYVAVINNRLDGEEAGQPSSYAEGQAAREAGLAYFHIPVKGFAFTPEHIDRFQAALDASEGPVLAHCKGGKRALSLYAIAKVLARHMAAEEVCQFGERFGFDLEDAREWLQVEKSERAV